MGEWIFCCWSCRTQTPMDGPVRRQDSCSKCLADMHACKNCRFFSPTAHNQCAEPIAEYVSDKQRSNFCGMYEAFVGARQGAEDVRDAKAKLEALFGK